MRQLWPVISLKQAGWPIFFNVFFETDIGREHLRKIWKKLFDNSFSEDILINAFVSFQSKEQNNSATTKIGWSVKAVVVFVTGIFCFTLSYHYEDGYAYTWVTSAYAPNRSR